MAPSDRALGDLRVLALLSKTARRPGKHFTFQPLQAAKSKWNWRFDIVCDPASTEAAEFINLAAPDGRLFLEPDMHPPVAPWESDEAYVAELNAKIAQAEVISGVPVGRIALAADSRLGRGFVAPVIHVPVMSEAPRSYEKNNEEPFRAVRRLFHWAEELLDSSSPDVIYSYEWALPWLYVTWLAAQRRGIPCIAIRRSKIKSGCFFFSADPLMLNVAASSRAAALQRSGDGPSEVARNWLREFRQEPQVLTHIQSKWNFKMKITWLLWHRNWARSFATNSFNVIARRKLLKELTVRRLLEFNRSALLANRQRRMLRSFSEAELSEMRYIYYPMHKETDLPLSFQAATWFDQRATVRLLASVMPHGYRLLVREHRRNVGLRPTAFYAELLKLPNVVLVDAYDLQFKYLRNASLVVTENGSSGWEGVIMGRKVLTLCRTFYDGVDVAAKLGSRDELARKVLDLVRAPDPDSEDVDRKIGLIIDAEFQTTFAEHDMSGALERLENTLFPLFESTGKSGDTGSASAIEPVSDQPR